MHATSTAFLAVTLKCARCHDHKFDPIPQTDYYAVLNFFIGGKAAEGDAAGALPTPGRDAAAGATAARRRSDAARAQVGAARISVDGRRRWRDSIEPPPDEAKTSERRDATGPLDHRSEESADRAGDGQSRSGSIISAKGCRARRTISARWAAPPTHPELLDWLAGEFVEGGWRIKRLHKLIMLSSTYQMDSTHPREAEYAASRFRQRALVARQPAAAGGRAAARRDAGRQRAIEPEGGRAQLLSAGQQGGAWRDCRRRGPSGARRRPTSSAAAAST